MKEKYFVFLFFGFVFFISIGSFLKEDVLYSKKENRLYEQVPELSFDKLRDGSFMSDANHYVEDQLLFRNAWLDLKFISERAIGKQENNSILFGDDKYMMKIESYNQTQLEENLIHIAAFAKAYNAQLYLMPTSSYVLDAYLPPYIHDDVQAAYFTKLKTYDWVHAMDDVLSAHIDEDIFYRSDHHITTLGQYYIYEAWAIEQGIAVSKPEFERVSSSFLGSYARASSNPFAYKDELFIIKDQDVEYIEYDEIEQSNSMYTKEYLGKQDEYAMFLDGNHGYSKLITHTKNKKHLTIIKDSYANSFVPYLLRHYESISVLDLRFYQGDIRQYLQKYSQGDVMMMYSLFNLDDKDMLKLPNT